MPEETRTPKFCSVCGARLRADTRVSGFDPFTGEPLETRRYYCGNVSAGRGGLTKQRHPSWTLNGTTWEQD